MGEKITCMGIESTAHTFGVAIVDSDGEILADVKSMFKPKPGKGMVPRDASNHHIKKSTKIIENALDESDLEMDDIDLIAFAQGPGLPPCLKIGASISRFISMSRGIDIVGVNHPVGHIEIGKLTTNVNDPIIVYLSGGNTQIIGLESGFYRIFGETLDIPIGNALDVVARELGLKSPGGPEIERLAKCGEYIELPYVVKGMDLSFSGIVTDIKRKITEGASAEDMSYSIQETCFSMLVEVSERALAHTEKDEILLVGGVAANKRLQEMFGIMCEERGADMSVVDMKYTGDCGAMIAWAGVLSYLSDGGMKISDTFIKPKWRVDEVNITWI